jgi:hypothetical protein
MDGNRYLKGSELGAAAAEFITQNQSEEAPAETDSEDPWEDQ